MSPLSMKMRPPVNASPQRGASALDQAATELRLRVGDVESRCREEASAVRTATDAQLEEYGRRVSAFGASLHAHELELKSKLGEQDLVNGKVLYEPCASANRGNCEWSVSKL